MSQRWRSSRRNRWPAQALVGRAEGLVFFYPSVVERAHSGGLSCPIGAVEGGIVVVQARTVAVVFR
jgi:hypothetical protein